MRFLFDSVPTPRKVVLISGTADPLAIADVAVTGAGPGRYAFDAGALPRKTLVVSGDDPLVVAEVTPEIDTMPVPRVPVDCPFTPNYPLAPTGPTTRLAADAVSMRLTASNMTLDLGGFRVGTLTFADGVNQVRVTNGRVGVMSNTMRNNADLPTVNNDLIFDHVQWVGGVGAGDGNFLRASRVLFANCSSLAASSATARDGLHTFFLWLDPGSADLLIQDCDLRTRGGEACLRLESSKRTIVHSSDLTCSDQKHCYRIHCHVYSDPLTQGSDQSWISDCTLHNRGIMIAALPDSTGPHPDICRRSYIKRVNIQMSTGNGMDSSLMLPPATLTPAGVGGGLVRLQHLVIDNLHITTPSTYNPLTGFSQIVTAHPEYDWALSNNTWVHV